MADNIVQVALAHDSALPEDVTVNTFAFYTETAKDAVAAASIVGQLNTFYQAFDNFLSSLLSGVGVVKFYDRADVKPRVPWFLGALSLEPGPTALPGEVALVLSFRAAAVSGSSPARRRGRVFLGPLAINTMDAATGRPLNSVLNEIASAASSLRAAGASDPAWTWQVWSEMDNVGREINNGYVDNAFDTQRSRGNDPTARINWGVGT
jgi:hypothetical protein